MARIRSIKPEFWDDEDLADLPRDARLLYIGTWNQADEHGRLRGNPKWIKGQVFPYDDDLDVDDIDRLLKLLDEHGKVVRYTVGGKAYMFLPNLDRHQRLEGSKVPSRLPSPDEADDQSARIRALGDDSRRPVGDSSPSFTPSSELHTDEAARGADEAALLYVAGSREQGAGTSASCAMQERSFTLVEPLTEPTYEVGSDEDPRWRDFWEAVPRKQGREDAREAWINHVLGKGTYKGKPIAKTEPDVMLNGMRAYAARIQRERIERQHIKMAQGWINGKRWEDEKAQPNEAPERQGVDLWA